MKKLISTALLAIASQSIVAQSISVYSIPVNNQTAKQGELICYDNGYLTAISDSMFRQGNPKYVLVDLFRDGYIEERREYDVDLTATGHYSDDGGLIPESIRKQYGEKWAAFIRFLGEPYPQYGGMSLLTNTYVSYNDIINPNSVIRTIDKRELHALNLTSRGELRLYNELIKDGLITKDQALNLSFNRKGFFVMHKELSSALYSKYRRLCIDEFGHNYSEDLSSIQIGSLPENTIGKEIAELEAKIAAVGKTESDR